MGAGRLGVKASIMLEEIGLPYEPHLIGLYCAGELLDYAALKQAPAGLERTLARPAVQRGLNIPNRG
jgi:hypothetical protein